MSSNGEAAQWPAVIMTRCVVPSGSVTVPGMPAVHRPVAVWTPASVTSVSAAGMRTGSPAPRVTAPAVPAPTAPVVRATTPATETATVRGRRRERWNLVGRIT